MQWWLWFPLVYLVPGMTVWVECYKWQAGFKVPLMLELLSIRGCFYVCDLGLLTPPRDVGYI
jgi:hypothetical protein